MTDSSEQAAKDAVAAGAPQEKPGMYQNPSAALAEVREYFKGWTNQLTQRSFELSMGLIAANWSVFAGLNKILGNPFAKASIAVVVAGLLAALVAAWRISELLNRQIDHAAANADRWEAEWKQFRGKSNPWPFTEEIQKLGIAQRQIKVIAPLIGGALFFLALIWQ